MMKWIAIIQILPDGINNKVVHNTFFLVYKTANIEDVSLSKMM